MRIELETDRLIAEIEDGIGWLTFNHPERHNALSQEMLGVMPTVIERFASSEDVRVVVMKGAGEKAFISGADITEFDSKGAPGDEQRGNSASKWQLGSLEKPLIAMIGGYCIGGGLATALAADIRIASDDSRFGIPAARLGLGYPFIGVQGLVDVVGTAYANEILFSARHFGADEAWRMGLLNRVVARDELEDSVRELAGQIAANAPLTVRTSKVQVRHAQRDPDRRDVELCNRLLQECFDSEDFAEGRRAFLEKRRPVFRGR